MDRIPTGIPIDDPGDPRIAHFVGLRDRELARPAPTGEPGVFIAEGDVVAERAISAGYRLRAVLVDATRTDPLPVGIGSEVPVYAAAPPVLQRITGLGVHRGLLGCFDRRPARSADDVLADARRVVVLERVSNPTNLGVILRSAAGLGMDAVLLDPTCSDPLYRRTSRVAMGEGYALPWAWTARLPGGLDVVRERGFRLVALTPDAGAVPIDHLGIDGPDDRTDDRTDDGTDDRPVDGTDDRPVDGTDARVALLLGAEGPGLSAETLDAADVRAGIPMRGGVDSLNVGVAAGIAFWVLGRAWPGTARSTSAPEGTTTI